VAAAVSYLKHEWSHLPLRHAGVTEIATAAHVSRGYLNRLFRDTFGSSDSVALEHLRCSRAEALLTRTDLTIAAIARQCGYADVTHLSHRFSGIHGISPPAYRSLASRSPSVLEQAGVLQLSRLVWERGICLRRLPQRTQGRADRPILRTANRQTVLWR
jgi:AraC-like DNA-binding protein